ncbi:P-loop containing nucleoside triphosphate hydrolase protein [Schizophyllum commune Loenen D]|nr:P-loop containing nucleoside triphosphate hydrolase protein [Schizophyllum commune Loenen D]
MRKPTQAPKATQSGIGSTSKVAPIFAPRAKPDPTPSASTSHVAPSQSIQTPRISRKRTQDDTPSGPSAKRTRTGVSNLQAAAPLAEKLRPSTLTEFVGQAHLTASDSLLMSTINNGAAGSMIFWGPPGCGKTTLARLIAKHTGSIFRELSATEAGIKDVRAVFEEAKNTLMLTGRKTILFLDEIHRFNKAQQDIFLPYVEQGYIQLIGATTENPSFKLVSPLLSRCRVFVLERLTDDDIKTIIHHAIQRAAKDDGADSQAPDEADVLDLTSSQPASSSQTDVPSQSSMDESALAAFPHITPKVTSTIVALAGGDARTALSLLELVLKASHNSEESTLINHLRKSVVVSYDRTGDSHYDMISALHKSVRGSDGNAAMYWLARMLTAGEDPIFIARRMTVCASEDIGLADNHALPLAIATMQACQLIGMPECRINLAHLVAYLAEAPKSTRSYEAYKGAEQHPVVNTYVPLEVEGQEILKKAGDLSGKAWDEEALRRWEKEVNGGKEWEGRGMRRA